ncbi:homocysteine methyltransferase [candidate division BRC1 bacterium HGW-BRC1-1]|jgi:5-methyltetrahydrofolate--homocysteine methyltransferase|nr:MAG: homocysteine methyltransferase [candidate division BRC1 bacterium HGW-BRC1-1]
MRKPLLDAVKERILLCDGAMGTMLQKAGLPAGACGEAWNVDKPEAVKAIQGEYADAGADCIITNTFGGSSYRLALHGEQGRVHEMNCAAARLAREVMGEERYVLGDIGPFGDFLEPVGETDPEDLQQAFFVQARALAEGGADAIIIETMAALDEIECAVKGAQQACKLPIIVSLTYDRIPDGSYRTMMGVSPEQAAKEMSDLGVDVIGSNCGTGIDITDHARIAQLYKDAGAKLVIVQPNAGSPRMEGGRVVYDETPELMASNVERLIEAGACIIGGCCGTTPRHIALFRAAIDGAHGRQ